MLEVVCASSGTLPARRPCCGGTQTLLGAYGSAQYTICPGQARDVMSVGGAGRPGLASPAADLWRLPVERMSKALAVHGWASGVWSAKEKYSSRTFARGCVCAKPSWLVRDPQQGLVKSEGKARYGEQYRMWQQRAADFEIDGQAPVRCDPAVQCGAFYGRCMSVHKDARHQWPSRPMGLLQPASTLLL